jgi:hypothetical protein
MDDDCICKQTLNNTRLRFCYDFSEKETRHPSNEMRKKQDTHQIALSGNNRNKDVFCLRGFSYMKAYFSHGQGRWMTTIRAFC